MWRPALIFGKIESVNAVLASNRRWESDADGLIRQIKSSPVIDLTADLKPGDPRTETA